jgi:hypothetical protein
MLTDRLLWLRDELVAEGVSGVLLLDGSYVSARPDPGDFDVALIAQPGIQALKEARPRLQQLLDAEYCQRELGFTLFFIPADVQVSSSVLVDPREIWDVARDGTPKGVLEVPLTC